MEFCFNYNATYAFKIVNTVKQGYSEHAENDLTPKTNWLNVVNLADVTACITKQNRSSVTFLYKRVLLYMVFLIGK